MGRAFIPVLSEELVKGGGYGELANFMRDFNIPTEAFWQGGRLAHQMRVATHPQRCVQWVLFYGPEEAAMGDGVGKVPMVRLRHLATREERLVNWWRAANIIIDGGFDGEDRQDRQEAR